MKTTLVRTKFSPSPSPHSPQMLGQKRHTTNSSPTIPAVAQGTGPLFDLRAIAITPPQATTERVPPLQRKMVVGAANDRYEQEADKVASSVTADRTSLPWQVDYTPEQRPDREAIQRKPVSQRTASGSDLPISAGAADAIRQESAKGSPLPAPVRGSMEGAFGTEFSQIRVHTDEQAHQLSQSLQARAFTTGQHIFFQRGEYHPGTTEGMRLLAHELSHVMQQQGSGLAVVQRAVTVKKDQGIYSISGRPDFEEELKSKLIKDAVDQGEDYIVHILDPKDKTRMVLPTIHRRHKVAWDLWKLAINQALKSDDAPQALDLIANIGKIDGPDQIDEDEIKRLCNDIFNADWNLWLGPGAANVEKGGHISSALEAFMKADKETQREDYVKTMYSFLDPRDIEQFKFDEKSREFVSQPKKRLSMASSRADVAARDLLAYGTGSKFAAEQVDKRSILKEFSKVKPDVKPGQSPYKIAGISDKDRDVITSRFRGEQGIAKQLFADDQVNLNSKNWKEIKKLHLVGETTARRIAITTRKRKGGYKNEEDFWLSNKAAFNKIGGIKKVQDANKDMKLRLDPV